MSTGCRTRTCFILREITRASLAAASIAIVVGLLAFLLFLPLASRPAEAADDETCDAKVHTRYELAYTTTPPGYRVAAVIVTDIADSCLGGKVVVTLSSQGDRTDIAGPVAVTGPEMRLLVNQGPRAEDVLKVTVQLSTLASIPPPTEEPGIDVPVPVVSPPPLIVSSPPPPEREVARAPEPEDQLGPVILVTPPATPIPVSTPEPGSPTPVIVAQVPQQTPTPQPPAPTPSPTPEPDEPPEFQPELVENLPRFDDIFSNPSEILSNAGLSAGLLALMLIDTTIFNQILKENSFLIHGFVRRRMRWFHFATRAPGSLLGAVPRRFQLVKPLAVLSLSALIYSLLDRDFGWNTSSLVLFLSLFIGLAAATYINDGGQVLVAERRFHIPFSLQFFPAAIGIAIASIGISRLVDIHPGIIFGFVAGAREASRLEPDVEQDGLINYLPMATLLVVSVTAWFMIGPIDSIAGGDTLVGTIAEASCAMLFVGSIQGLLFTLLPFDFMDGQKVWRWNKLAWFSIAVPVAFLFFHTVLNQGATLASASSSHGVIALYASAIFGWVLTIVAWLYFRRLNSHVSEELEDAVP